MEIRAQGECPHRVFVVEDGSIVAHGLSATLLCHDDIDVVGVADDSDRTVELIRQARPQVVVIASLRHEPARLIDRIRSASGISTAVLLVAEHGVAGLGHHTSGYGVISWRSTAEQLAAAVIDAAHRGPRAGLNGSVRPAGILPIPNGRVRLSNREIEVLLRAADGQTNSRIARALSLSEATVKTYWQRVFKKLNVHDRTTAVTTALAMGVLTYDPEDSPDARRQHRRLRLSVAAGAENLAPRRMIGE
ncbi:response regulator transcription factor [Amycolatopsis suaedae]|uniref:Response regulator transcription factor n=1 Tax=Amycolatopsis suaedae TaxID=2510978 RepID=A0A4Q7J808_9PSEU|nr:response regulator transcription factor [Amycolatopsis suaedae]RZQ62503.1 response regulator transcription factor [Amycolatopsis suaedae]